MIYRMHANLVDCLPHIRLEESMATRSEVFVVIQHVTIRLNNRIIGSSDVGKRRPEIRV